MTAFHATGGDTNIDPATGARQARKAYFGEGGIASWQRVVRGAAPDNKLRVWEMQLGEALRLGRKALIDDRETIDRFYGLAVTDHLIEQHGEDAIQAVLARAAEAREASGIQPALARRPRPAQLKDRLRSASEIRTMTFKPVTHVVPEYVTQGLTILAGKPKSGKSWLMLDACIAVAAGRSTLGNLHCPQGDVLYLALEDSLRRLQKRLEKLLSSFGAQWPERLTFATEWPRLNAGGLGDLDAWCGDHPNARLIVIDTFEKVRTSTNGKGPTYGLDYEAMSPLHDLAHRRNIAIVIIHHTRKMAADDVFDTVSGTLGLTGAADTTLVLQKTSSGQRLNAVGRDIEEKTTAVDFDKLTCRWKILGDAAEVQRSGARTAILRALRGAGKPMGPKAIAAASGVSHDSVRQLVGKMVKDGELKKDERGYAPLTSLT